MITQVAVGVGQSGKCGRWVRDGGGSEKGTRANLQEKKTRVNADVCGCLPVLLLSVCFSSLNGASMYVFD